MAGLNSNKFQWDPVTLHVNNFSTTNLSKPHLVEVSSDLTLVNQGREFWFWFQFATFRRANYKECCKDLPGAIIWAL